MAKKYKVKYTTILHNQKTYPEGSIIELEDKDAKRLEDFLQVVKTANKTKTETQGGKDGEETV
jgi:hypothetical protein